MVERRHFGAAPNTSQPVVFRYTRRIIVFSKTQSTVGGWFGF
jgi:hypothetical protein